MDGRHAAGEFALNTNLAARLSALTAWNFFLPLSSKTMSSPSTSHDEADLQPTADASVRADSEFMRKAQKGDRGAYGHVVLNCQDRLYNAVLRMVGNRDEARELTQEAFTRGLEKISGFRGDCAPYTWLFRIAMNLAISQLRKVQRQRVFSLDRVGTNGHGRTGSGDQASRLLEHVSQQQSRGLSPAAKVEQQERQQQVLEALGRIDAEYRALLVMRDVEGFDYRQMAEVLDLPLGTLKSRLFRARLALREELKGYMQSEK
jgi:RNA polymerase sigma-70 factor (ECF subfamily)